VPLPKPSQDENRAEFVSRCMSNPTMRTEFPDNNQRLAVCGSQFDQSRKQKMSINDKLLDAIRARSQKKTEFGYGILTADCYVRTLQEGVGNALCYRFAANRQTSFDDVLRKAANTLVFSSPDMVVDQIEYSRQGGSSIKQYEYVELPKNTLMVFKHTLITPRKDRDGDVLHPGGMEVDPQMLLLWQHVPTLPIGKMLMEVTHNEEELKLLSCIVDMNDLCHDAAVMVDNSMGRFSHGFRALEYTKFKAENGGGFNVKRGEIMEESLVSVPSNVDAGTEEVILSLVEGGKLHSPMMKEYGKTLREKRPTQVPVELDLKITVNGEEVGNENKSGSGSKEDGGGKDSSTASKEADADQHKRDKATEDTEVKGYEGRTREADGHTHAVMLDDEGNGTAGEADGHTHKVKAFKVEEADGHIHSLSQEELKEKDFSKDGTLALGTDSETGAEGGDDSGSIGPKIADRGAKASVANKVSAGSENQKRGRVLSKRNEALIRDAIDAIGEVVEMEIPRPAKATLREAMSRLGRVLESLGADEPKQITVNDATAVVLACATVKQRSRLMEVLGAMEQIDTQEQRAKQFRELMGQKYHPSWPDFNTGKLRKSVTE